MYKILSRLRQICYTYIFKNAEKRTNNITPFKGDKINIQELNLSMKPSWTSQPLQS